MHPLRCLAPLSSLVLGLLSATSAVHAQAIGEVDTVFKLFGPDWERRQVEKRLGRKL